MSFIKRFSIILCLFLFLLLPVYALTHKVGPSDTLFGLARQYEVPQSWIVRANNLQNEIIRTGTELEIPVDGLKSLSVRPGDTLSSLALELRVSQEEIISVNQLKGTTLFSGQKIRVPKPLKPGTCRVLPGDTLTALAKREKVSLDKIRAYNALTDDVIYPGQILTVRPGRPDFHQIENGESLWLIASKYSIALDDLKKWNNLEDKSLIHPGTVLTLHPGLKPDRFPPASSPRREVTLASVNQKTDSKERKKTALPRKGEYYFSSPLRHSQPDTEYWEDSESSTLTDYQHAQSVLKELEEEIQSSTPLSSLLSGQHIVLDPGHGGMDPGAIVTVKDGNGNPLTVTEDEYAYDIAIRLYKILRRHGASVSLTVLAPDHLSREGENPRQTFVNKKNEVYNNESHNGNAGWRPVGTAEGLDMRKETARQQINRAPLLAKRKGTLFLSIHADNSPELPAGRAVLFFGATEEEKESSRELAQCLASKLGSGAFIKEQTLRVLQNNPADAAVLVETRNVYYERNCWALRSPELREQDAQMLAAGILKWCRR